MAKIFGEVDRTKEGKIKSEMPSWYFDQQKEELEDGIKHKERMLEEELVPASERNVMKQSLKKEKEKLENINASRPQLKGPELDEVIKITKEIGSEIASSLFTHSDMEKGTADAHEEARRISTPVIKIATDKQAEFAKECGITIKDGKITRKDAEKMWKIGRRLQGEISNTEMLRKR